ncbi:MAG: hypothetical protein KJO31_03925, partial [Gammaproteobacteria bacterium]|nr:hypothetical protein [Gammaproteobacteria bacterium]
RPQGSRMANLSIIEFDSLPGNQATVTMRFDKPVEFDVRQSANLYMLTVIVTTDTTMVATEPPPDLTPDVSAPVTGAAAIATARGESRRVRQPDPDPAEKFVIRLADLEAVAFESRRFLEQFDEYVVYSNEVTLDQRHWTELRLGFFETEQDVHEVLAQLKAHFPAAWVSLAGRDEQLRAENRRLPMLPPDSVPESQEPVVVASQNVRAEASMPEERITSLMIDARAAMLQADYAQSIRIYSRLLEEPGGTHRREAREFLGVARQKNGQVAHAKAEFEAYLQEFPDGTNANRVRQRLAALSDIPLQARMAARAESADARQPQWDFYGGVSQFYLRGVDLTSDDEADVLAQSALLSQADFVVKRRGERFDLVARGNLSFLYDFDEDDQESQALVSYAYLDITDNDLDWNARLGRQTRHRGGHLGRFDGAHVSYGLLDNVAVNVSAGFPIDSPRFVATLDHYFYGASVEVSNLYDSWDFGAFTNFRNVDGISDRQAVGADLQYHTSKFNVVGLVDYDVSYNVLNLGLITGSWRFNDRITVNGRYQGGTTPFLTTRNALIGQPVRTIDALLDTYTESQIRTLARNRTAQTLSGSAGVTADITERWQINADFSYYEHGYTLSSGGVEGMRASGPQYIVSGHLLGSSVVKAGDAMILGYRHFESRDTDYNTIYLDARLPFGEGLRINPRIALTSRASNRSSIGPSDEWIANPMLRVLYRWRQRYRIEFEIGGQWANKEFDLANPSPLAPDGSFESSAYYMRLGYWVDFR